MSLVQPTGILPSKHWLLSRRKASADIGATTASDNKRKLIVCVRSKSEGDLKSKESLDNEVITEVIALFLIFQPFVILLTIG